MSTYHLSEERYQTLLYDQEELKTENRQLKEAMLSSHQITRVIIMALERDNTPVRLEMAAELKACLAKSCELLEKYGATS